MESHWILHLQKYISYFALKKKSSTFWAQFRVINPWSCLPSKFVWQDQILMKRKAKDCSHSHILDILVRCLGSEVVFKQLLIILFLCTFFFKLTAGNVGSEHVQQMSVLAFDVMQGVLKLCCEDEQSPGQILNSWEVWKGILNELCSFVGYYLQKYIAVGQGIDMASTVSSISLRFNLFQLYIHYMHLFFLLLQKVQSLSILEFIPRMIICRGGECLRNPNMFISEEYIQHLQGTKEIEQPSCLRTSFIVMGLSSITRYEQVIK